MHAVAGQFIGLRTRQQDDRPVEPPALPPVGIAPGQVHRRLRCAGQRLTELVAGHEQPLAKSRARRMELPLLGIGPVGGKDIRPLPPVELRHQQHLFPEHRGKAGRNCPLGWVGYAHP